MLSNRENTNYIADKVSRITLSEKQNKHDYSDLFYFHLTSLFKFKMVSNKNDVDEVKLTFKNYLGTEQFIFEHSQNIETDNPKEINWQFIDNSKDLMYNKISKLLKNESKSQHLKPIVDFTISSFENWLIYDQLHPNSISNPWIPTNGILENGYLFLVSDNRDLVESYTKNVYQNIDQETKNNVGIITKTDKSKNFSGFIADNRHNLQGLVFEYLRTEAFGLSKSKSAKKIQEFLKNQKIFKSENEIKANITLPLKRSGLIGSTTNGFYFISSREDLLFAYQHHKEKLQGIQRTLDLYKERGRKLGINNFD